MITSLYYHKFVKIKVLGVDDMFVIIQCMDNLDDDLDPKEKVAQVSASKDKMQW